MRPGPTFHVFGQSAFPTTPVTNSNQVAVGNFSSSSISVTGSGCFTTSVMWSVFRDNNRGITVNDCGDFYEQYNLIYGLVPTAAVHGEFEFLNTVVKSSHIDNNTFVLPYSNKDAVTAMHSPYEGGLNGATISITNNVNVANLAYASYSGASAPIIGTNSTGFYADFVSAGYTAPVVTVANNWHDHTGASYCNQVDSRSAGIHNYNVTTLNASGGSGANPPNGTTVADNSLTSGGLGAVTGFTDGGFGGGITNPANGNLYTYTYACP